MLPSKEEIITFDMRSLFSFAEKENGDAQLRTFSTIGGSPGGNPRERHFAFGGACLPLKGRRCTRLKHFKEDNSSFLILQRDRVTLVMTRSYILRRYVSHRSWCSCVRYGLAIGLLK